MAQKKYFEFIELQYDKLTEQINSWLKYKYKKADIQFNSASPYGQIINVEKELFLQNILYLKNTLKILDVNTTQNKKVIQQTARIAGHSVGRPISATGTLKFKLKAGIDYQKEIKSGIINISNKLALKNKNNDLDYVVNLTQDKNQYSINTPGTEFYIPIIQGKYETQTFTGDGTINQSISVNIPNASAIENFNYKIIYNTIVLEVKDHLYDMLPKEFACFVKSGFNGGIDIYFGTDNSGFVPQIGSQIIVEYLLSNGSEGEILNPTINEWKIIDDITDGQGNIIKIDELFDIFIENDVNFSSDGENIEYTKTMIPYVSRNFVLATPNQFIFHLKRLNIFSKVNAFNMLDDNNFAITDNVLENYVNKIANAINTNKSNDEILASVANFKTIYSKYKTNSNDNIIYLYLIPDISKFFNDDINYFNINSDVFTLDQQEQQKTLGYLKQIGTLSPTTSVKIIQPTITKYIMHVYVRRFENANEENIKQQIISISSDYLLNNNRFDRISKSDFIELFKQIDGIDSVSLYFVSEQNENYQKNQNIRQNTILQTPQKIENGIIKSAYKNSEKLIGLDPVHGDIVINKDEYAIIRGGFRDRKGIWYSENPNENTLNSINITFDGITK